MLPVVPEALEAGQAYELVHTSLHQFVQTVHNDWFSTIDQGLTKNLNNSLLSQDKAAGGALTMNFDKQLLEMSQEVGQAHSSSQGSCILTSASAPELLPDFSSAGRWLSCLIVGILCCPFCLQSRSSAVGTCCVSAPSSALPVLLDSFTSQPAPGALLGAHAYEHPLHRYGDQRAARALQGAAGQCDQHCEVVQQGEPPASTAWPFLITSRAAVGCLAAWFAQQ